MSTFVSRERARQVALRDAGLFPMSGTEPGVARGRSYPFVLPKKH